MAQTLVDELAQLMTRWNLRTRQMTAKEPGMAREVERCRVELGQVIDREPSRALRKALTREDLRDG